MEPENKKMRFQLDKCQVKHLGKIILNIDKVSGNGMLKNTRRNQAVRGDYIAACM